MRTKAKVSVTVDRALLHEIDRLADRPFPRHRDELGLHPPPGGVFRIVEAAFQRVTFGRRQLVEDFVLIFFVVLEWHWLPFPHFVPPLPHFVQFVQTIHKFREIAAGLAGHCGDKSCVCFEIYIHVHIY